MEASPVSLYLDLAPGSHADLEVVARAAIAFSNAIRDAAYIIDPSLDIRVEILSGTEGSLSLNSVIRSIKERDLISKKRLKTVALLCTVWFGSHLADKGFDGVWDAIVSEPEMTTLSDADKAEIAEAVVNAIQNKVATPHVESVYSALRQDPSIVGVGATTVIGEKPVNIVPRASFPERAGEGITTEESDKRRERKEPYTLTLISPVLKSANRRWKFSSKEGEFGAYMKDAGFIEDVLTGRRAMPMVSGIEMDVLLRTVEEKRGGVWHPVEREILEVRRVRHPASQQRLRLPAPRPKAKTKRAAKKR